MPTTFDFGRSYGNTPGSTVYVSSANDVSVTAVIDDDVIDIGDLVTFDGLNGTAPSSQSGITDGEQVYYLGRLDLGGGKSGYIFSKSPSIAETDSDGGGFVMLTDSGDYISSTAESTFNTFLLNSVVDSRENPVLNTEPACFLEGTLITTTQGEVPVQDLTPGDLVVTMDGRNVPVMFVGRQTVGTAFGIPERLRPVWVAARSLGDGIPKRNLTLTADHALFIENLLINAGALVNADGIQWAPIEPLSPMFRVYHVETEEHDLILAEGCPAETYYGTRQRREFENFSEYKLLYPDERILKELPHSRVMSARLLPDGVKRRLSQASEQLLAVKA